MYGDGAHSKLLRDGWMWDGYRYHKLYPTVVITMTLGPLTIEEDGMLKARQGGWKLVLENKAIENLTEKAVVAEYPNLNTAAMVVGGIR